MSTSILNQKRDKTYYKFDNQFYGKSRLVHALMSKISKKYSIDQLNDLFNKDFKSAFDICETYHAAKKLSTNHKRYFVEKDEILVDKYGIKICICNQISISNINPIISKFRKKFHYKINTIKVVK